MATQIQRTIPLSQILYSTTLHLPPPSPLAPHRATAPLIVLSHALMADSTLWDPLLPPLLSQGYRILTYDHPGHGASSPPPPDLTPCLPFDLLVSHLHALISAHNEASYAPYRANPASYPDVNLAATANDDVFALVGCSMGAVLALRYAMLYPTKVARVVAVGAPGLTALDAAKGLWEERIRVFEKDVREGSEELVRLTVERWLPGTEGRSEKAREKARAMTRRCGIEGYRACAGGIRGYDYTGDLGRVEARVLVVVGDRDSAVGERAVNEDVARRCEGRFVWLEGAGHLPPIHLEEEFGKLVVEFLEEEG
ncbi:alpha/beta hydrolase fold-containing protein 25 [Elsinoe australis]|uniref:Alpha/beta hydrolase fold-containing protein 25 n=1 Tax=Elsinoe australis TaxID=40998 RepID=A0A4U7ASL5_9PEZI|nr:alpha/beta hydrolase fold-containing protein 25 [Elsinoe australis]